MEGLKWLVYMSGVLVKSEKKVLVTQLCLILWDPMNCSPPSFSVHGILWSGSLSLLQGIFLTQGSNPGLLHCRQIFYHLTMSQRLGVALGSAGAVHQTTDRWLFQHGGLRVAVRFLTWWLACPRACAQRELGKSCMDFSDPALEGTQPRFPSILLVLSKS